ncbi:MAG: uroporphyrinogen decarboxylase family protein [Thermofilum sp.]
MGSVAALEPAELLRERRERLEKAYANRAPDRVPLTLLPAPDLAASYAGLTTEEFCFSWEAQVRVAEKWGSDFNVEGVDSLPYFVPGLEMYLLLLAWVEKPEVAAWARFLMGPFHDILQDKYTKWPGRELAPTAHPQFTGGKFMEADEYRFLAEDPLGFVNERVLPRAFGLLSRGRAELYPALVKLGVELQNFSATMAKVGSLSAQLGYPSFPTGWGYAPLDLISDFLRYPTHTMLDLRRHPDDVKAAVESLTPVLRRCVRASTPPPEVAEKAFGTRTVLVFFPLHLNEMLPPKLFEEFYWPSLREVVQEALSLGAKPWIFFEGNFTPFLHYLEDLPKGRVVAWFERTDLRRAREALGDHVVLMGGLPLSLLMHGSREKVYEEACKLLTEVKEPGGFIFAGGQASPTAATRIENLWAVIEATLACGRY